MIIVSLQPSTKHVWLHCYLPKVQKDYLLYTTQLCSLKPLKPLDISRLKHVKSTCLLCLLQNVVVLRYKPMVVQHHCTLEQVVGLAKDVLRKRRRRVMLRSISTLMWCKWVSKLGLLFFFAFFWEWEATSAFEAHFIGDEHGFSVPETMKTFQSPRRSWDFFHLKVWRTWQKVKYSNSQMLFLHWDNSPSTTPWTTMSITVNLFLGR